MSERRMPLRVSIVATPEAQVTPLSGLFEVLNSFGLLAALEPDVPAKPFEVEIVAPRDAPSHGASGLPIAANRSVSDVDRTDIAIVPLMMFAEADWKTGRYPDVVDWLQRMHRAGATLCSTCTGVLLLAETGLLAGREATIHWAFAPTFQRNFPNVGLRIEEVLITAGDPERFVMTGGVFSWHDLALHLITRHVGPSAAQSMARLMLLDWHSEGQAPYVGFLPPTNHGDAMVLDLQRWLEKHFSVANPIVEMSLRCSLSTRSLERRFMKATGHSPLDYVQNMRVEAAKRLLERTDEPVDGIGYDVGYENLAFFRRVFKRNVRMTPAAYRRKFLIPPVPVSR
jgi:transcriptional regulator GlxA family with amidase domain